MSNPARPAIPPVAPAGQGRACLRASGGGGRFIHPGASSVSPTGSTRAATGRCVGLPWSPARPGTRTTAQVLCVKALLLHRQGRTQRRKRLLRDLIKTGPPDLHVNYAVRHQLAVRSWDALWTTCRSHAAVARSPDGAPPDGQRRQNGAGIWPRWINGGANCWPH